MDLEDEEMLNEHQSRHFPLHRHFFDETHECALVLMYLLSGIYMKFAHHPLSIKTSNQPTYY